MNDPREYRANRDYMLRHPEIRLLVTTFISECIYYQPENVPEFARLFFRNSDVHTYVSRLLGFSDAETHVSYIQSVEAPDVDECRGNDSAMLPQSLTRSANSYIPTPIRENLGRRVVRSALASHNAAMLSSSLQNNEVLNLDAVTLDRSRTSPYIWSDYSDSIRYMKDLDNTEASGPPKVSACLQTEISPDTRDLAISEPVPEQLASEGSKVPGDSKENMEDPGLLPPRQSNVGVIDVSLTDAMPAANDPQDFMKLDVASCEIHPSHDFAQRLESYARITQSAKVPLFVHMPSNVLSVFVQCTLADAFASPIRAALTMATRKSLPLALRISSGSLLNWTAFFRSGTEDGLVAQKNDIAIRTRSNDGALTSRASSHTTKNLNFNVHQGQMSGSATTPFLDSKHTKILSADSVIPNGSYDETHTTSASNAVNESSQLLSYDEPFSSKYRPPERSPTAAHVPLLGTLNQDFVALCRTIAPHISGLGCEEYEYGALDIASILPDTYFVCTNLSIEKRDYTVLLQQTELRDDEAQEDPITIINLCTELPIKCLYGRQNTFHQLSKLKVKLLRFLPVVVKTNFANSGTGNLCMVFVSFLPTTSCDKVVKPTAIQPGVDTLSELFDIRVTPLANSLYDTILDDVAAMLAALRIEVFATRLVILSPTHCFGRSSAAANEYGNFASASWLNTQLYPHPSVNDFLTYHCLCYQERHGFKYSVTEDSAQQSPLHRTTRAISSQPHTLYDYEAKGSMNISVGRLYVLRNIVEKQHVAWRVMAESALARDTEPFLWPYKAMSNFVDIHKDLFTVGFQNLYPFAKFILNEVAEKSFLMRDSLVPHNLLERPLIQDFGSVCFNTYYAKSTISPFYSYLAHKIRDCAIYNLPLAIKSEIASTDSASANSSDDALRLRVKHTASNRVAVMACFSARSLVGNAPGFANIDFYHRGFNCSSGCLGFILRDAYKDIKTALVPDDSLASFFAKFPHLFVRSSKLYCSYMTLEKVQAALVAILSRIFENGRAGNTVVADVLPYLTNVGICFTAEAPEDSFLFNLEKLQVSVAEQFTCEVRGGTLKSKVADNKAALANERLLVAARQFRLSDSELTQQVVVIVDEFNISQPFTFGKFITRRTGIQWHPLSCQLVPKLFNKFTGRYEVNFKSSIRSVSLTMGSAVISRYYPEYDSARALKIIEEPFEVACHSIPAAILHETMGTAVHFAADVAGK